MLNSEVPGAGAPRADRSIGWRWLRLAFRELLLAMHHSRRNRARQVLRDLGHLRNETWDISVDRPLSTSRPALRSRLRLACSAFDKKPAG